MEQSTSRHSSHSGHSGHSRRHRHSRSERRKKNKLKVVRYSFVIFFLLLITLLFNIFFHPNKTFLLVEAALAGLAYLFSLQNIVTNSSNIRTKELTFYLVTHAIVAMGIIFFFVADKLTGTTVTQITGID